MQEDEILSVARFKLGETARRLLVLAEQATDAGVRATLIEIAEVLFSEQRAMEVRPRHWIADEGGNHAVGVEDQPAPTLRRAG